MLLIVSVIALGVLLIVSLIANILFYQAADRQLQRAEEYERLYQTFVNDIKERTLQTYLHMQQLDDKQIFSKDDEVGLAFREILDTLQKLNEVTQEEGE